MATGGINHIDKQMEQKSSKNSADELHMDRRCLVLLGKSGHGKSSTGNRILNKKVFSTSSSTSSHTKYCRLGYRPFDGIELVVCDTVGMFDTESNPSVVKAEIGRAVDMVYPGPHAFLIHYKIGNRFTDEEQQTIKEIQDIFGEDASKYCILILTGEDNLMHDDETIENYLKSATPGLKQLLAQCQNHYITLNNHGQQDEIDDKIRQLLKIIEKMLVNNQTTHYSKEQLQRAAQLLREREQAAMEAKSIETEKQRQSIRDEMNREFALREKAIEEDRRKLDEMLIELRCHQHDENTQQRPTVLESVCSVLPQVAEAFARAHTIYQQNQQSDNNEYQNVGFSMNTSCQSSDDSSSEEEERLFISTNPHCYRNKSDDFRILSDSSSDSDSN